MVQILAQTSQIKRHMKNISLTDIIFLVKSTRKEISVKQGLKNLLLELSSKLLGPPFMDKINTYTAWVMLEARL